jgi:hypothetical protein
MIDFVIGEEVWLLRNRRPFVRSTRECINLCIYRGKTPYSDCGTNMVQYIIDGKLGMTSSIGSSEGLLFKTLEELKTHLINVLKLEIQECQKKIDSINDDIDYVQSLKDIGEDRENKLNELGI